MNNLQIDNAVIRCLAAGGRHAHGIDASTGLGIGVVRKSLRRLSRRESPMIKQCEDHRWVLSKHTMRNWESGYYR